MLSNLPKGEYTEKDIIEFMKSYWDYLKSSKDKLNSNVPLKLDIAKVVLAYDISEYIEKVS